MTEGSISLTTTDFTADWPSGELKSVRESLAGDEEWTKVG